MLIIISKKKNESSIYFKAKKFELNQSILNRNHFKNALKMKSPLKRFYVYIKDLNTLKALLKNALKKRFCADLDKLI